jgi:hypothetical protein
MSGRATELIEAFEALPGEEKRAVTAELLSRALPFDSGPLDDEETALAADSLFATLDEQESQAQ